MKLMASDLPTGVRLIDLAKQHHPDDRGSLTEAWRADRLALSPVQLNVSTSNPNVLRGLHFHRQQTDYWFLSGGVFVALADVRTRQIWTRRFDALDRFGLLIPPGVAHGFYAFSTVVLTYLVDELYDGTDEFGVAWNDPLLAIPWPTKDPVLSDRDRRNKPLADG